MKDKRHEDVKKIAQIQICYQFLIKNSNTEYMHNNALESYNFLAEYNHHGIM